LSKELPTGFEVVLPDGDLLRTGAGALPDGPAWHLYKRSLGPSLDPLFTQSNLGVVTRMGVWLKRRPPAYAPVTLTVGVDGDLETAVDTLRELRLAGHLEGIPALFSTLRASHMLHDAPVKADRQLAVADLAEIAESTGLGAWAVRTAVWGDPAVVAAQLRCIERAWAAVPSGRFDAPRTYTPDQWGELIRSGDQIMVGIPNLKAIEGTPPTFAHVNVSPVVPLSGTHVRSAVEAIRTVMHDAGLNFAASIMVIGERSCAVIIGIRYDKSDPAAVAHAFATASDLIDVTGGLGYGESRPHLDFMDRAANQYSFNNHAYHRFVQRLKDAVDPAGVLAPGRHGIWPAARQDQR
jgi:4-cresol dehydrogenase (hydroxylating)